MPGFAAKQLLDWVYAKQVVDPAEMTNLSADHRALVSEMLPIEQGRERESLLASDGTRKLLIDWPSISETASTETVLIPAESRATACVSSQVGCPVGCAFCASGMNGLEQNLSAGQIVEQVHRLGRLGAGRVSNVVFMGMGEPLANFAAVTQAITTINAPWGLGIGARRITVSTIGVPEAIRRLATFALPITLAISLHAPEDALRRELIPWAAHARICEILDACRDYFDETGREITFEYLLLRGVNDRPHHARMLADLASTLRCNINLIRYNEVPGLPFERPAAADVHDFQSCLRERNVNAHIRASRGRDIDAACGQLRRTRSLPAC
jgi:23S rRNA (adenine2503-C2)-methyltransferase